MDSIQWPCPLSEDTKQALIDIAQTTDSLSHPNEQGVFYVLHGIAFVHFSPETVVNTMNSAVIRRGIWVGSPEQNKRIQVHSHVEEVSPLQLVFFPHDKLNKLCEVNLEVYKFLYHSREAMTSSWLTSQLVTLFDKETRIVYTLTELAEYAQNIQGSVIRLELSQKQLSTITGISRPRLNEVLKNLESANELSLERGNIFINDLKRLKERLMKIENAMLLD
ncbi:Crp/Fnr family transcriptional regulator [Vibrio maerlii]|uniref:Crp/Fnr family transcriptional regulator n=1 Tax=Vibrio maerlii TaxID=2231648 RepID=UPI000E3C719D|nr:helix-turn-helix domain-containing protein [Vibrio maerlii]